MGASGAWRVVAWVEWGVLSLGALFLGAHTMPRAWKTLNTDFPNYYMSARMVHERFDTAREYEWLWLEREKDHRGVDIRVIGLLPITPISTLAVWPLTPLAPLAAKHVWIVFNLALLIPLAWLLWSMTGLSWRRVALVFALSFPLHRNLLFGQFYVLLLLLLVAACWSWLRGYRAVAGGLVALAALCKVFPVLLFVFFLQRRDWRALFAGLVTGLAGIATSVAVFGWNLHRTYLHEVLPWTLHGEALPPYATASASISSVLHYLFLREPQWNPHPWHSSPFCYALLQPTLQMLVLAPAILLIRRGDTPRERVLLEWSALVTAALAISTSAASYDFVLMAFPVCVLAARLLERGQYLWVAALTIVYLGIGFPMPSPAHAMGPAIVLWVPRLPLMLALLASIDVLLGRDERGVRATWEGTQTVWAVVLVLATILSIPSTFERERAMRQEFAFRTPQATQDFLEATPQRTTGSVAYVAFTPSGYHLAVDGAETTGADASAEDELSFSISEGNLWVELAGSPQSNILEARKPSRIVVRDARDPMVAVDGESLAFVRDVRGRGQLFVRRGLRTGVASESALTPGNLSVYEATFQSEKEFAFSAVEAGRAPQIYITDAAHTNAVLTLGEARYPALSPDGRWLAYSRLERGVWNLWIRDESDGALRRIADVPCNQIQPSWEEDSKTLLYGTDCGRSLWFTAVAQRRAIP